MIWVPSSSSLRKRCRQCGGRDEPGHGGGGNRCHPIRLRRAAPGMPYPSQILPNTDVWLFPELLNVPLSSRSAPGRRGVLL